MSPHLSNLRSLISADGALILDLARDRMTRLNQTGGQIWLELQRGKRVEEIAVSIAIETGEDLAVVRRDIEEFCLLLASLLGGDALHRS